jgi:glycerol transport system ATP-binding protein
MARIDLQDIAHRYATDAWALMPMSMTWNDGGAYALLGPSGCGKTTLLNIISGLVTPTQGKILFDGRDVTSLPPEARNIAQVFQFPVVYDTMTVFENLAFPLRNRGWSPDTIERRVQQVAEILELTPLLESQARAISADQKQKISLGRGLVRPDVAAVLFDEPLTVIDPELKWLLRRKLKQIHHELKLSLIYVTHDQTEALTFADQVVVMSQGEVVQIGTAQALFETPAHRFVGHFIGTPGMNFLSCSWANGASMIDGVRVATASSNPPPSGAALSIGVRPEYLQLADAPGPNRIPATVVAVRDQGTDTMVRLEIAGATAWAKLRSVRPLPSRGPAFAWLPPDRCALYADDRRVA